jgi:hypothetical protein
VLATLAKEATALRLEVPDEITALHAAVMRNGSRMTASPASSSSAS